MAVREYQTDVGPADYVLFVDKKPVGVIEAKREEEGVHLTVHEEQSEGLRFRGNSIFIDLTFEKVERPISFQIETYNVGGHLSGMALAQYYTKRITEFANEIKNRDKKITFLEKDIGDLNKQLDNIEIELRNIIVETLLKETGREDFESLLTGDAKQQVKRKIKEHINTHPNATKKDFKTLRKSIQFFNLEHLKKTIIRDDYWAYFKLKFKEKSKLEKYFHGLSELRNVIRHSREMTDLILYEGKAALEWFNMAMKNRDGTQLNQ